LWSLATLLTTAAGGFVGLVAVRFVTGLFESGAFPGGTRALVPWFGRTERAFVQGAPHLFGRFATALVPLISVSVAAVYGWRGVFVLFGALGLVWALGFWVLYRDRPADHPRITPLELALATDGATASGKGGAPTPWRALLTSRTSWGLIIGSAAYTYCIFFYTTWLPTYLVSHRGFSMKEMGIFASLPLVAGMVGDVAGGMLSDAIVRRTGRLGMARKAVVIPAYLLAAVALVPAALVSNPYASVMCLALSLFFMELMTGPWWSVPSDVAGGARRHPVGNHEHVGQHRRRHLALRVRRSRAGQPLGPAVHHLRGDPRGRRGCLGAPGRSRAAYREIHQESLRGSSRITVLTWTRLAARS